MSEKGTAAVFETSGGARIRRIPVEAFPGFWAYVYLLQKNEHHILIDAGSGTDASHENLLSGLEQAGLPASALTHILLTHAHIDHFGGLTRLRPLSGARIGVHELDLQTVAHHEARLALIGRRLASFLADTGLEAETREQALSMYRFSKAIYRSVPVDFTLGQGGLPVDGLDFIHLPGHCPGHVALRMDDIVFCGDMVVERVTPHLSPESINPYSGLDHYLDSLGRFEEWSQGARLILNGHNEAITDLPPHIEATKQNILRRVSKVIEALTEPRTIAEVCRAVYGEMNGYGQLLVIEKTGAYLEYLYERGMIAITNPDELGQGRPACYRNLGEAAILVEEFGRKMATYTGRQVNK